MHEHEHNNERDSTNLLMIASFSQEEIRFQTMTLPETT